MQVNTHTQLVSQWDVRVSGSLKAHSLLLAASVTVKWCRAAGALEMSKNIPLQPCCWTCQAWLSIRWLGLSLPEMFPPVCLDLKCFLVLARKTDSRATAFFFSFFFFFLFLLLFLDTTHQDHQGCLFLVVILR